jgi:hypothetical protein
LTELCSGSPVPATGVIVPEEAELKQTLHSLLSSLYSSKPTIIKYTLNKKQLELYVSAGARILGDKCHVFP